MTSPIRTIALPLAVVVALVAGLGFTRPTQDKIDTATPAATAATRPISSGSVMPSGPGAPGMATFTSAATYQPTKAANSIMPSMPMLTTPERSFMKPHSAPRAMGVERVMIRLPLTVITDTRYPMNCSSRRNTSS